MKGIVKYILCLSIGIEALVACTKRASQSPQQQPKTFVYCSESGPNVLNSQIGSDATTNNVTHALFNRLVEFEYGTTNIIPGLAESWEVDDKGLEYTFVLRKGVKFHTTEYFTPTRDFNADDVLFSFQRQMDPKHPYHSVNGGIYEYFNSTGMKEIITSLVKVNDTTVKMTLSRANAPFVANLAMNFSSIFSKEYADKLMAAGSPEKIDHEPIGTGPFTFVDYQKDVQVRMKAFPEYFGKSQRGNIENLIYSITPDASVRLQKLKANECQLMVYPDPADLEAIRKDKNLELLERPGFNIAYLAMNVKKKPFDNKLVRQAVHHALNRKSYIDGVYLGNAQMAKSPLPPMIWSYNDQIKDYEYSPEKAKNLLKKAGLSKGFEADLWTLPVVRPYLPSGKRLGEMMQKDLAQVGIRTHIVTYDWGTYLDKSRKKEHTLLQMGWTGDNGDPDNFLYTLLSCSAVDKGINYAAWCHKPFNDLISQAQRSTNLQERTDLYRKAQEIFKEEVPWVTLVHSMVYRAKRKGVSGYKITPLGRDVFEFIQME